MTKFFCNNLLKTRLYKPTIVLSKSQYYRNEIIRKSLILFKIFDFVSTMNKQIIVIPLGIGLAAVLGVGRLS